MSDVTTLVHHENASDQLSSPTASISPPSPSCIYQPMWSCLMVIQKGWNPPCLQYVNLGKPKEPTLWRTDQIRSTQTYCDSAEGPQHQPHPWSSSGHSIHHHSYLQLYHHPNIMLKIQTSACCTPNVWWGRTKLYLRGHPVEQPLKTSQLHLCLKGGMYRKRYTEWRKGRRSGINSSTAHSILLWWMLLNAFMKSTFTTTNLVLLQILKENACGMYCCFNNLRNTKAYLARGQELWHFLQSKQTSTFCS